LTDLNQVMNRCITYEGGKQRKLLRATLAKRVAVTAHAETKDYQAIALSEGGIYLRKATSFPVGTEVVIHLPLKDGHSNSKALLSIRKVSQEISSRSHRAWELNFRAFPEKTPKY